MYECTNKECIISTILKIGLSVSTLLCHLQDLKYSNIIMITVISASSISPMLDLKAISRHSSLFTGHRPGEKYETT
jgi:hypothetical protein